MNPFDELPRRDRNHQIEDQALAAFSKRLVTFTREMTTDRLCQVAALARSGAKSSRNRRVAQTSAGPNDLLNTILDAAPEVRVPDNQRQTTTLLQQLYDQNADDVISANFERFAAAPCADHDFLGIPHMSEKRSGRVAYVRSTSQRVL